MGQRGGGLVHPRKPTARCRRRPEARPEPSASGHRSTGPRPARPDRYGVAPNRASASAAARPHRPPVHGDPEAARRVARQKDVFRTPTDDGTNIELLMHEAQAQRGGIGGSGQTTARCRPPTASSGPHQRYPPRTLIQRGFSSSVLAHQRMHFRPAPTSSPRRGARARDRSSCRDREIVSVRMEPLGTSEERGSPPGPPHGTRRDAAPTRRRLAAVMSTVGT